MTRIARRPWYRPPAIGADAIAQPPPPPRRAGPGRAGGPAAGSYARGGCFCAGAGRRPCGQDRRAHSRRARKAGANLRRRAGAIMASETEAGARPPPARPPRAHTGGTASCPRRRWATSSGPRQRPQPRPRVTRRGVLIGVGPACEALAGRRSFLPAHWASSARLHASAGPGRPRPPCGRPTALCAGRAGGCLDARGPLRGTADPAFSRGDADDLPDSSDCCHAVIADLPDSSDCDSGSDCF